MLVVLLLVGVYTGLLFLVYVVFLLVVVNVSVNCVLRSMRGFCGVLALLDAVEDCECWVENVSEDPGTGDVEALLNCGGKVYLVKCNDMQVVAVGLDNEPAG